MHVIDLDVIRNAEIHDKPYRHIIGEGFLQKDKISSLRQDFPAISKPGFLTVDGMALRGSFRDLVE